MLYVLIFFLAFWAGFSVRRGSLCLVRATLEVVKRKPPKTIFFILQAMVVALSITIPAMIFFPDKISLASSYGLSWYLVIGAILYGIGASINGSCALGTLNQLMSGKVDFLATIIGMTIGFFIFLNIQDMIFLQKLNTSNMIKHKAFYLAPLMFLVWGVAFFQIKKFLDIGEESKALKLKQYMTSSVARDFIGITIFGFCSGALFLLLGSSWDYTHFIRFIEINIYEESMFDFSIFPIFITTIALILGVGFASILSKDFKFEWGVPREYILKVFAGSLMGFSVGLIPGGNDTLILYGIPGLALHVPVALFVMMVVIGVLLFVSDRKK